MTTATIHGLQDFDFIIGQWMVTHRRLKRRLAGSSDWETSAGTMICRKFLEGAGNIEEHLMPGVGYTGGTLRLYDPEKDEWSLYWASSRTGLLYPAVVGRFRDGAGEFFGLDTEGGVPVRVRYIWSRITPTSARWEQAFSVNDGRNWETNWYMDFSRTGY